MAYDEKRFYCVNKDVTLRQLTQVVRAVSLEDGSPVWSCPLRVRGEALWSLALTQRYVIAYPQSKSDPLERVEIENIPVIVRLRETGALVQRFVFPATIADALVKADSRGALVATARGIWGLGSKEASSALPLERVR
jgi:hypothetical protein